MTTETIVKPKLRGKGRPPKSELQAVRDRTKGKVGRPAGDAARLQEFKERLLATGGSRILDKMVEIAMTDGHPGQMAAMKLVLDRIVPASAFDSTKAAGGVPQISINISGLNDPVVSTSSNDNDSEDIIDV